MNVLADEDLQRATQGLEEIVLGHFNWLFPFILPCKEERLRSSTDAVGNEWSILWWYVGKKVIYHPAVRVSLRQEQMGRGRPTVSCLVWFNNVWFNNNKDGWVLIVARRGGYQTGSSGTGMKVIQQLADGEVFVEHVGVTYVWIMNWSGGGRWALLEKWRDRRK